MVMGPTHALQGFGAGLAVSLAAPALFDLAPTIPQTLAFAVVTAGAAIAPDLDHPSATASRSLGPVTGLVARTLHHVSGFVYRHTKTARDSGRDGTHRGITHTWPGALAVGAGVAAICRYGGLWGTVACLFLFALFALRALPPKEAPGTDLVCAAGLAGLGYWVLPPEGLSVWTGVAVVVGMLVHCLGDALTESGVPLLWPIPLHGKRWYPVRTPALIRFRASGPGDRIVRALSLIGVLVLLVALVPGAWSWVFDHVAAWRTG